MLYPRIYAALDADGAGTLNAARLAALSARITPVRVPAGKDVTEFAQQGGAVRAWVGEVVGVDGRFPLRLVIPPDQARRPELALPEGQWQRREDGSIEVVFASEEEWEVCQEVTQVVRMTQNKQR